MLVTPEWRAVLGVRLAALRPFPEARERVAEALAGRAVLPASGGADDLAPPRRSMLSASL